MTRDSKLNTNNLHILLVEDDLVSQFLLKETLHMWNTTITVDVAGNGIEALEKLKNKHYDLILLDIHMPKMDGYETTRIIRTEFAIELRNIPIIAMTGQSSFENAKFDMNGFIPKPFESDVLFETIERVILK